MKKHLKPMVGFTKGIVLLALTYVLIGAIDGNPNYTEEIMKLTDYRYLLAQVIFAGMSGVIIAYMVAFFIEFTKKGTNGKVPKVKDLPKFDLSKFDELPASPEAKELLSIMKK